MESARPLSTALESTNPTNTMDMDVHLSLTPNKGPVAGGNSVCIKGVKRDNIPEDASVSSKNWRACPSGAITIAGKPVDAVMKLEDKSSNTMRICFRVPHGVCHGKVQVEVSLRESKHPLFVTLSYEYARSTDGFLGRAGADSSDEGESDGDELLKRTKSAAAAGSNAIDAEDSINMTTLRIEEKSMGSGGSMHLRMLHRLRGTHVQRDTPALWQQCLAELIGTLIIVIAGVGSVNAAVATGAQAGLWQVAVVWGFGVSLAIYSTASISGAHLNPAVSLAFALLRPEDFGFKKMMYYWGSQVAGGVIGGFINYLIYGSAIIALEERLGITRGEPESIISAQMFGEYFPNPGFEYSPSEADPLQLSSLGWNGTDVANMAGSFGIEAWGTGILMFMILSLTDDRNVVLARKDMAPFFIGFTVAVLISLYAPLNQAGFNPARDFGPRLASVVLGWGTVAIPGPRYGFWTYILGPMFGAPIGGAVHDFLLMRGMVASGEDSSSD